jgi:AraC family transcriptional regulator
MSHLQAGIEPVSFGTVRFRNRTVPGLLVTAASFPATGVLPPHYHDRPVVATAFRGAMTSHMNGRTFELRPSATVIEPRGERHANEFCRDGAELLVLQPDPAHESLIIPLARLLSTPQQLSQDTLAPLACRLAHEIGACDAAAPLAIQALALELLATAARLGDADRERRPRWLLAVRERLHDDPLAMPRLEELAQLAGVHMGHLTRAFRKAFGCSIGHYARAVRLSRAAARLHDPFVPLAAVAVEAGFADQSHFTRFFRRQFGCTPHAYRLMSGARAVRSSARKAF